MIETFYALSPELLLCATALAVLLADLFGPRSSALCVRVASAGLLLTLGAAWVTAATPPGTLHPFAGGVLTVDPLSQFLKLLIGLLTLLTVWISSDSFAEERRHPGEYYSMLCFSALGMMVVVSATELLTFFVAFELLSIPLYMLAAFRRYNRQSAEAGLKYFLNGAVASALLLFGASWIYGSTGSTHLRDLLIELPRLSAAPHALFIGLVMVLSALAFKAAAAPFHMWAPDVYQGAPTPVAAFLSSAPKAAVVAFVLRLFWAHLDPHTDGAVAPDWVLLFAALATLSMILGNLVALPQKNVKRLMAYSGIAHIGYILVGVVGAVGSHAGPEGEEFGAGAALFYTFVYTLANLATWAVLIIYQRETDEHSIAELSGLARRSPFLGLVLMLSLLSLAGVPPLAGFVGKIYLFRSVLSAQPVLVLIGILTSVISLYYYFGILKAAYFEEPADPRPLVIAPLPKAALTVCVLGVVLLGMWPGLAESCLFISDALKVSVSL